MRYKSYSQSIFGRSANGFEGVDQGFDPHAESENRVPYSMDIDYSNGTLMKRDGFEKYNTYTSKSVMSIARVDFKEGEDEMTFLLGDGSVYYVTGL